MEFKPMTGVILAGGEGKRLGSDKTEIVLAREESVMEMIISKMNASFEELLIITSESKKEHYKQRFSHLRVSIHADIFDVRGAIAGVHSGLYHASHHYSFFVGCDMPFLNFPLIDYFKQIAEGNDVVVAQSASGYEPLHAIYSKSCIPYLTKLIGDKNLRIYDFYPEVGTRIVLEDEVARYDPERLSFFNINTRQALHEAHQIYKSLAQRENCTL